MTADKVAGTAGLGGISSGMHTLWKTPSTFGQGGRNPGMPATVDIKARPRNRRSAFGREVGLPLSAGRKFKKQAGGRRGPEVLMSAGEWKLEFMFVNPGDCGEMYPASWATCSERRADTLDLCVSTCPSCRPEQLPSQARAGDCTCQSTKCQGGFFFWCLPTAAAESQPSSQPALPILLGRVEIPAPRALSSVWRCSAAHTTSTYDPHRRRSLRHSAQRSSSGPDKLSGRQVDIGRGPLRTRLGQAAVGG